MMLRMNGAFLFLKPMDVLEYWWVLIVICVAAIVIAVRFVANKRAKAFRAFAEGSHFAPLKRPRADMKRVALLRRGYSRSFKNVYETVYNDAVTIRIFDYSYKFGVPFISTVETTQTVVAFKVPGIELPEFAVAAHNSVSKVGKALGRQGIVPLASATFAQRYILTGPDREAVKMSLRPEAINLLEQLPKGSEWSIESGDGWLVFYRPATIAHAYTLEPWITSATPLANAFWGHDYFVYRSDSSELALV
jgi:hypothetical protein